MLELTDAEIPNHSTLVLLGRLFLQCLPQCLQEWANDKLQDNTDKLKVKHAGLQDIEWQSPKFRYHLRPWTLPEVCF